MKGLELPVSAIILIGISLLVLVSISMFFISGSAGTMSTTEAQRIFYEKCQIVKCALTEPDNIENAKQELQEACSVLYGDKDVNLIRCMEGCGCTTKVTKEGVDELIKEFAEDVKRA